MAHNKRVHEARADLLAWTQHKDRVRDQVVSGFVRDIYPRRTMRVVLEHLSELDSLLTDQVLDAAGESEE